MLRPRNLQLFGSLMGVSCPVAAPVAAEDRGACGLCSSVPSQAWGHVLSVLSLLVETMEKPSPASPHAR